MGQVRSTQRYAPVPCDFEVRLVEEMTRDAQAHPRWGYRRVHALLVADGWAVNVKRIERLWRARGLESAAAAQEPPRRERPWGRC